VVAPLIRDATPADLPRLLELLQQLSEDSEYPEESARELTPAQHAALARVDADPRSRLLVLEDDGGICGTMTLYVVPNLSHGGAPFAVVENVVVDRDVRGGGLGKLLMERALALAWEAGCYKVSLTSNRKRAGAHAFYERIG
jgi:GNAT superfamily N-acetyltransferase